MSLAVEKRCLVYRGLEVEKGLSVRVGCIHSVTLLIEHG